MTQSLNNQLANMMDGKHVLDTGSAADRLHTYYDIQTVKNAMRIRRSSFARFMAIKNALKNYHVIVTFTADDKARVFDPQTKTEMIL